MKVPNNILKKIAISIFAACITIASSFVTGYLVYLTIGTNDTIISGYFSAAGGVLGGSIGGVVAFFAAKAQIDDLHQTRYEERQIKYIKILEAIISENIYNKSVLTAIVKNISVDSERAASYEKLLESEVWDKVKFDENNLLPRETFRLLNKEHREYKDMRMKMLKEYQEESVDHSDLITMLGIINSKLNNEIELTEANLPKQKQDR